MPRSRWLRFNGIGALGFVIQLACLGLLVQAGIHYLAATAIAVEVAVLHNFAWHEQWTWADRPAVGQVRLARLMRFQLVNGGVSLIGNLALMPWLVRACGLPPVAANAIAVLTCTAVNFLGADRLVFSHTMEASGNGEEDSKCA